MHALDVEVLSALVSQLQGNFWKYRDWQREDGLNQHCNKVLDVDEPSAICLRVRYPNMASQGISREGMQRLPDQLRPQSCKAEFDHKGLILKEMTGQFKQKVPNDQSAQVPEASGISACLRQETI